MAGFSVPPLSGRARRRSESVRPELPGFGLDDNNDDAGGWEDDHDDNGMQMDDNAASGPGSTQQAVLDRLMENAQRNGRKMAKALEAEKDKIIKNVETDVDTLIEDVEKDVNERLQHVERLVASSQAIHKKVAKHQLERLDTQVGLLQQLLREYERAIDAHQGPGYLPSHHVNRRRDHAVKLDRAAAKVAVDHARDAKREQQMANDIKRFTHAHKQLFKTLGSGPSLGGTAISAGQRGMA